MTATDKKQPAPADPAPDTSADTTEEGAFGQLQADLERFRDLALRSQADFDNFRTIITKGPQAGHAEYTGRYDCSNPSSRHHIVASSLIGYSLKLYLSLFD